MLRGPPKDTHRRHPNKKAGRSRVPADKAALTAAHSFHTNHHPTLSVSSVSIRGFKLKRSKQNSGGRGSCQAANLYRLRWNFARPVVPGHPCLPCPSVVEKPRPYSYSCSPNHNPGTIPSAMNRILTCGSDGTSPSQSFLSFEAIRVFRVHPWF